MTEDEKREFVRNWILEAASEFDYATLVETLQWDEGVPEEEAEEVARDVADLIYGAKVEVSWDE